MAIACEVGKPGTNLGFLEVDKKLIDEWKKLNNVLIGTTKGGRNNQLINFTSDGRTISVKCFGDVAAGEAIALRSDDGQWWVYQAQSVQINQQFSANKQYQKTTIKRKILRFEIAAYIEFIGEPFSFSGITTRLVNSDDVFSTALFEDEYVPPSEILIEFDFEEENDYSIRQYISSFNPDFDKVLVSYSDIARRFKLESNQLLYTKNFAEDGSLLTSPQQLSIELDDNKNQTISTTICKPFVFYSFPVESTGEIYTKDLNFLFASPISSLRRVAEDPLKNPADRNRNFVAIWILDLVLPAGVIAAPAMGYVDDEGFLKRVAGGTSLEASGYDLTEENIFRYKIAASHYIELKIGCADIATGDMLWLVNGNYDRYQALIAGLFEFKPFSER